MATSESAELVAVEPLTCPGNQTRWFPVSVQREAAEPEGHGHFRRSFLQFLYPGVITPLTPGFGLHPVLTSGKKKGERPSSITGYAQDFHSTVCPSTAYTRPLQGNAQAERDCSYECPASPTLSPCFREGGISSHGAGAGHTDLESSLFPPLSTQQWTWPGTHQPCRSHLHFSSFPDTHLLGTVQLEWLLYKRT